MSNQTEEKKNKRKEYMKKWRKENPEKCRAHCKKWYIKNPEKVKNARKKWMSNNKEKIKAIKNKWRLNNKDKVKEHKKKYNEKHKEEVKEQQKNWRLSHKEKINNHRKNKYVEDALFRKKILARDKATRKIKIPKNQLCETCNINLATERHHPDYSKPLEVKFLCRECHNKIEKEEAGEQRKQKI